MRIKAGFFLALLLLTVPALANAWTLAVKVAGGTDTNKVSVAYGNPTVSKDFKSTVSYLYPVGPVTVTAAAGFTAMTLDGTPVVNGVLAPVSGNHTLSVTYAPTSTNSGLTLRQSEGGAIYAQNRNNTWTSSSISGLVAGTAVPVSIAADAEHRIVSYSLDGGPAITAGVTNTAGQVLTLSAAANNQTVTATFALLGNVSASLSAPTNGSTGKAVTTTVTATSNAGNLQYAFAVSGPGGFSQTGSGSQSFSFTPPAKGTYTITATVNSDGNGSTTASASVLVEDAQVVGNTGCVSCHSTQPALHTISAQGDSCGGCHGATPHDATVASHSGASETNCSICHAASVATVRASIHYTAPSSDLSCADCHSSGPNPTISAAACSVCHVTVDNHTAATMGSKSCTDCHDGHNPKNATAPLLGAATAHPAVTLYTFEEIGMQMAGGQKVPVQVDASGNGMPYSPKQTCGTAGCHVKNGVDYTYDKISDHAFHAAQGRNEYVDAATGKFDATKSKPWLQSTAMVGKW